MTAFLRTNALFLTLLCCASGIILMALDPWPIQAVGVALVAAGLLMPFLRLGVRPTKRPRIEVDQSVFDLPLGKIVRNTQTIEVLNRHGIVSIGDLLIRDPDEIVNLAGMGPLRLAGLRDNLVQQGILPAIETADEDQDAGATIVEQVSKWLRQQPAATA